jgi:hypothetical protein
MTIDGNEYVLAIMPNNRSLHVGMADSAAPHMAGDSLEGEPDYYDKNGRPLVLITAQNGNSVFTLDLRSPGVAEAVLLARINAALDHLQEVLNEQIRDGVPGEVGEVPRPSGSLEVVLGQLAIAFDFLDDTNKGNWFHNLAHAAGIR